MPSMTVLKPKPETPMFVQGTVLRLSRGGRTLFDAVSFHLWRGGILLIEGPNGAGKSSLLQLIAGFLRPDAGKVGWYLDDPDAPKLHYLGHAAGVKPRLTVAENLRFWRDINGPTGLPVAAALEQVGLGGLDDIEAGHLSAGQTRRLGLARLLVSRRPVWLLDEPTAALDAEGHALVGRLISAHAAAGGTVAAATHDAIPGLRAARLTTLALPSGQLT